jgi:hypothetical protein
MADGVVVKHNIPAFKKQVSEFGADMERKIFRAGTSAAAVVFKRQIEKNAPTYRGPPRKTRVAGTLKKNILIKRLRTPQGQEHYYAGVRGGTQGGGFRLRRKKGAPPPKGGAFYWWMVEAGHRKVPRGQKITGGRRLKALKRERFDKSGGGQTEAVEYIERAWQQQKQPALDAFIARVEQRIAKENAKRTPR